MAEEVIYSEAPRDLLSAVSELINLYHPELADASIGIVFRDQATKTAGRPEVAKTSKVRPQDKFFMSEGFDFIVVIAEDVWVKLSREQRLAALDHELCHMAYADGKASIFPHDIEEFSAVLKRHGPWNADLLKGMTYVQDSIFPESKERGAGRVSSISTENALKFLS